MKLSCCIDMMFSYLNFYDRIEAVKNCGINTIEFWKWSNKDLDKLEYILKIHHMDVSIFNLDSRNEELSTALSKGILNDGKSEELIWAIQENIPIYKRLRAKAMILLIGEGKPFCRENVLRCLKAAAVLAVKENVNIVVEPLNSIDRIGYCMPYAKPILEILRQINCPNIKMLYDIYHQSMMNDFSIDEIWRNIDLIGHFHVADAPGRHEPGTGRINYPFIFRQIQNMPYHGYIGLEYRATKADEKTIDFFKEI